MTELWAISDICAWAKLSRKTAYRIIYRPGFPTAIRIDGGHPRWVADEVKDWFDAQREAA